MNLLLLFMIANASAANARKRSSIAVANNDMNSGRLMCRPVVGDTCSSRYN